MHATPCGRGDGRGQRPGNAQINGGVGGGGGAKERSCFFFFSDQSGTDFKDVTSSVPLSGRAG